MEQKLKAKVSLIDEEIAHITISGEITVFIEDFEILMKEITAYIKMGIFRFILDLSDVTYIDSSGIGLIMRLITAASKKGLSINIICDQPQVLKVFKVSNIERFVSYIETVDEGLQYFKQNPPK